jgi:hypothetical protein
MVGALTMADNDIETYLATLPTEFQSICKKLHSIARSQMPDAQAIIYHGAICYSTSPSAFDPIFISHHNETG